MTRLNQDQLRNTYIDWLRARISIDDLDGVLQITSPYLDVNNDRLQLYVISEDNALKLSDDGHVINELEFFLRADKDSSSTFNTQTKCVNTGLCLV